MRIRDGQLRLAASDVANFLACHHLTRLDLLRARGELAPPQQFDIGFQDLVRRGETHEREVLERFRREGWRVVDVGGFRNPDADAATAAAIQAGADVIYQGALTRPPTPQQSALLGYPDFLVRADLLDAPDAEPRPAGRYYEVVDAKLARTAKARALAQTAFYSALLADLQGTRPRWMHLALGTGELVSFKVGDYAAYERQSRIALAEFIASDTGENPPSDPYPEPVEHCAICRWSDFCSARRRRDDDLSLIAGITGEQRRALKAVGIPTRRGFAEFDGLPEVRHAGRAALLRAKLQARLQVASEDEGRIRYELLDPERDDDGAFIPNRGLLALPEPVPGDLFFDIEGARYYTEDNKEFGLQYLFGVIDTADLDEAGTPRYTSIWAFDRAGEKRAFEELVDFITERRQRSPRLHVYHYNHYEPTSVDHLSELHETRQEAVGRLMGRFATREDEVDDLFRLGVFVDLYRVVRQGLRAGVESYSIKRLEPLCGYRRQVDLRDATRHLIGLEAALDDRTAASEVELQRVVAGYNADDCRATLALRDWLEQRRAELAARLGEDLGRPAVDEVPHATEDPEVTRIRSALLAGVPADEPSRSAEQNARVLLADLLDWHRREAKPQWWRYFEVRKLSPVELTGEPDAIGELTGGKVTGYVKKSELRSFSFPAQEHKFAPGDTACDPVTGKTWTVEAVEDASGLIVLRIGVGYSGPLPKALVEQGPIATTELRQRLRELGDRVARGGAGGRDAATALLLRSRPEGGVAGTGPLRREQESATDAAMRLVLSLRGSYLPVQGPPGSGKTYAAAEQVLALVSRGRKVGITGPSHAVISHLIATVAERAAELSVPLPRIGQKPDTDCRNLHPRARRMEPDKLQQALLAEEIDVAAGTAWLWARPGLADTVDTLFVDEAGQMSLANVLAIAGAAHNVVLLGDPQQLAQPSQAAHPPGTGVSALEHILGDQATMPAEAGLLLDRTWRMHPELCRFVSEVFYDGKLETVDGLENQRILGDAPPSGSGLRVIEERHSGNASTSPEEASRVASLVCGLLRRQWRDRFGAVLPLDRDAILVVTPYNAQIRAIRDALGEAGCDEPVRVGTVDKFQGREAPVAIYSMATSSADEAPRGLEFLYDPHRLNVATSRARAMAIIVASPDLVRVSCRTPRQMFLANALCRAWETGRRRPARAYD